VLTDATNCKLDNTVLKLLGDTSKRVRAGTTHGEAVPGTGNALARRALFDTVGTFRTELTYGEDAEWFRRARRHGARIAFTPDARISHMTPASRLTSNYLLKTADRGAASRVRDDFADGGLAAITSSCALRVGHVALSGLRYAWARLRNDPAAALGRRCSMRYSGSYITHSLRRLVSERCR